MYLRLQIWLFFGVSMLIFGGVARHVFPFPRLALYCCFGRMGWVVQGYFGWAKVKIVKEKGWSNYFHRFILLEVGRGEAGVHFCFLGVLCCFSENIVLTEVSPLKRKKNNTRTTLSRYVEKKHSWSVQERVSWNTKICYVSCVMSMLWESPLWAYNEVININQALFTLPKFNIAPEKIPSQ